MGHEQGRQKAGSQSSKTKRAGKGGAAKTSQTRNQVRNAKYNSDPTYRDGVKKTSRQSYRKKNPKKPSSLAKGVLQRGTLREVEVEGIDELQNTTCYTMTEAATALDKNILTLKRWIKESLMPPPVITDTTYGYVQYSEGELKLIAKILKEHEEEFNYLHSTHTVTINQLWQQLESYRKHHI